MVYISPILKATVGIWNTVQESRHLSTHTSPFTSFIGHPDFPPAKDGDCYIKCPEANCKKIGDFFDAEGVMDWL